MQGKVFHLHTPEGFGTSKLAGWVDRAIEADTTARNWNTVRKLIQMADAS